MIECIVAKWQKSGKCMLLVSGTRHGKFFEHRFTDRKSVFISAHKLGISGKSYLDAIARHLDKVMIVPEFDGPADYASLKLIDDGEIGYGQEIMSTTIWFSLGELLTLDQTHYPPDEESCDAEGDDYNPTLGFVGALAFGLAMIILIGISAVGITAVNKHLNPTTITSEN